MEKMLFQVHRFFFHPGKSLLRQVGCLAFTSAAVPIQVSCSGSIHPCHQGGAGWGGRLQVPFLQIAFSDWLRCECEYPDTFPRGDLYTWARCVREGTDLVKSIIPPHRDNLIEKQSQFVVLMLPRWVMKISEISENIWTPSAPGLFLWSEVCPPHMQNLSFPLVWPQQSTKLMLTFQSQLQVEPGKCSLGIGHVMLKGEL